MVGIATVGRLIGSSFERRHMNDQYDAIRKFIRDFIIAPSLEYNHLATTTSAIRPSLEAFRDYGWRVEETTAVGVTPRRHKIVSPDGAEVLNMVSATVYRHPSSTARICQNKPLTKRMLEFHGVPTPKGVDFKPSELASAVAFISQMEKPIVVKPSDAGGSHGVSTGVTDEASFTAAWRLAIAEGGPTASVVVEEFVRGVELRALVVGDSVVSYVARVQPFVVGNGNATMEELVADMNGRRSVHYRSVQLPVVLDWGFIGTQGHSLSTIPHDDEIVLLNPFGLPSNGSLLVEMVDLMSIEMKELAVRARRAIPELEVGGVDILVKNIWDARTARVVEVNTSPSLNLHRYVTHGEPRDVLRVIVDYFHNAYLAEARSRDSEFGDDVESAGADSEHHAQVRSGLEMP